MLNEIKKIKENEKIIDELKIPTNATHESNNYFLIFIALSIILIVASLFFKLVLYKAIFISLGIITFIIGFFTQKTKKAKRLSTKTTPTVDYLETKLNTLYENYSDFNKDEIQNYFENNLETLEEHILEQTEDVKSITAEVYKLQFEKERLEKEIGESNHEDELENLLEQKKDLDFLGDSIKLAAKELEKSYFEMKKDVIPAITEELSNTASCITNEAYTKVAFSDESGITVQLKNGDTKSLDKLSIGTIKQLYLSLRIAILKLISKENETVPILIDEAFAYFDIDRLKNTLHFLQKISKNQQIIIFSCNKNEVELLKNENIDFNLINL